MNIYKIFTLLIVFIFSFHMKSQGIKKVEPPNWWTGMENKNLQLLVYGNKIAEFEVSVNYNGVKIAKINTVENPNYLFVDLIIEKNTKPGKFELLFKKESQKLTYTYELKEKNKNTGIHSGFNSSDVIYLVMPDRFANGNPKNDSMPGMLEKSNRSNPDGRHGGDLKGIRDHLDYFKNLGVTALWLNPCLEANLKNTSYHGYAISDFYKVDPRHGTNEEYQLLAEECHKSGLKIIMDMIFNHSASTHWFIKDMPSKDWVHQFPEFTRSNYRGEVASDPYASDKDKYLLEKGWFDITMPDLNQENPYLANYLIQNSIWWIEFAGLDGIRMDTYPYPYQPFMKDWVDKVMKEYPGFNIVGESWLQHVATTAFWQKDFASKQAPNTFLPSVTDFPFHYSIIKALNDPDSWTGGLFELYYVLAQDFLYPNPKNNLIFLDNHDLTRIYSSLNYNFNKFKTAMAILLTSRGIPQIYYGTEILMDGGAQGDGLKRQDFPGGWDGDKMNAFTMKNMSVDRLAAFEYTKKLLNWRKGKDVIHNGALKHFIPENETYVYFRYNDKETVMVLINKSNARIVNLARFNEHLKDFKTAKDVVTDEVFENIDQIYMEGFSTRILELKK
ncbi:MAG: glycoside hydrolase family 13 protein [Bacteroidales bacterium]